MSTEEIEETAEGVPREPVAESEAAPLPDAAQDAAPEPEDAHEPETGPEPEPEPEPEAEPVLEAAPEPQPEAAPEPRPEAEPVLEPEAAPPIPSAALPVPAAPAPSPRRRALLVTVAAVLAVVAFAFAAYGPELVTVDGRGAWVPRGTTVADLAARGLLSGTPGDLLSARGKVLARHSGSPPIVRIGDEVAAMDSVVPAGASVTSLHGRDSVEIALLRPMETPPPSMRYAGSGPVESVEDSGTPGLVIARIGIISGDEVSRRVIRRGTPMTIRRERAWHGSKEVALTFDDGPWPGSTDAILAELKAADVKATFFMIGRQVIARPETARHVLAGGMEIGNHTQNHKLLAHASRKVVVREIERGRKSIESVLGVQVRWYRPAGGSTSPTVYREARRLGLRVVLWTVDPRDWSRPGKKHIARRVLDRVRPGSVILMHDGGGNRSQTVAALKKVLKGLKARGYKMVTLSRLYRLPAQVPTP